MSHDLCLCSHLDEFPLVGAPDADGPGLGRERVLGGNVALVVKWYEAHCHGLGWSVDDWVDRAGLESSCLAENDGYTEPPEWADPAPVERHLMMIDAFLAFAPGARFGAS